MPALGGHKCAVPVLTFFHIPYTEVQKQRIIWSCYWLANRVALLPDTRGQHCTRRGLWAPKPYDTLAIHPGEN